MHLQALKRLPDGTEEGDLFETNAVMGRVLIIAGAAREVDTPDSQPKTKRTYKRRDLRAEL